MTKRTSIETAREVESHLTKALILAKDSGLIATETAKFIVSARDNVMKRFYKNNGETK